MRAVRRLGARAPGRVRRPLPRRSRRTVGPQATPGRVRGQPARSAAGLGLLAGRDRRARRRLRALGRPRHARTRKRGDQLSAPRAGSCTSPSRRCSRTPTGGRRRARSPRCGRRAGRPPRPRPRRRLRPATPTRCSPPLDAPDCSPPSLAAEPAPAAAPRRPSSSGSAQRWPRRRPQGHATSSGTRRTWREVADAGRRRPPASPDRATLRAAALLHDLGRGRGVRARSGTGPGPLGAGRPRSACGCTPTGPTGSCAAARPRPARRARRRATTSAATAAGTTAGSAPRPAARRPAPRRRRRLRRAHRGRARTGPRPPRDAGPRRCCAEAAARAGSTPRRARPSSPGRACPGPARPWPCDLTDREVDVLRLAARGLSNRAIAGRARRLRADGRAPPRRTSTTRPAAAPARGGGVRDRARACCPGRPIRPMSRAAGRRDALVTTDPPRPGSTP